MVTRFTGKRRRPRVSPAVAIHGREAFVQFGKRSNAIAIYADTQDARRLRGQDLGRMRNMTAHQKSMLLRTREQQFGLPSGTLTEYLPD